MTFLGNHPGGKGWIFMRGPNNIIFSAAQAIFDESLFPKCPKANVHVPTRLQTPAPSPRSSPKGSDCQCPFLMMMVKMETEVSTFPHIVDSVKKISPLRLQIPNQRDQLPGFSPQIQKASSLRMLQRPQNLSLKSKLQSLLSLLLPKQRDLDVPHGKREYRIKKGTSMAKNTL